MVYIYICMVCFSFCGEGIQPASVFKTTTLRTKPKVGLSPLLKVFILYPLKK